jgi:hypothetical protein
MPPSKKLRPAIFADPANDRLAAVLTALSAEVSTVADRLDSLEILLVERGVLKVGELDQFRPRGEDAVRRRRSHDAFMSRVFYILKEEFDALG